MPGDPARGRVGWRLAFSPRDTVFLACLAFCLTVLAIAFSNYEEHKAYTAYCKTSAHAAEQDCKAEKPLIETVLSDPAVFFTFVTAFLTGGLIVVGVVQAGLFWWQLTLTRDAVGAALEQTKLARDSLIASNRAWLTVDAEISHQPLTINEHGASTVIAVKIWNTGNARALQLKINVRLVAMRQSNLGGPWADLVTFMENSGSWHQFAPALEAKTDFPATYGIGASLSRAELEEGAQVSTTGENVKLFVIGGVDYTFEVDAKTRYKDTFIRELDKPDSSPISLKETSIAPRNLILRVPPFS